MVVHPSDNHGLLINQDKKVPFNLVLNQTLQNYENKIINAMACYCNLGH
jgi:hypothetical protein